MPIVLAYHGCSKATAHELLGGSLFRLSNQRWDWLGNGAYFWEWDAVRAYQWAEEFRTGEESLVGAAIELGNCLDLTTQRGTQAVEAAYASYKDLQTLRGEVLLENKDIKDREPGDLALRFLDRAVIQHLHENLAEIGVEYDTVRALFPEGEELYPKAGFWKKTHVQIAVRKVEQIRGVFRLPIHELREGGIPDGVYRFGTVAVTLEAEVGCRRFRQAATEKMSKSLFTKRISSLTCGLHVRQCPRRIMRITSKPLIVAAAVFIVWKPRVGRSTRFSAP